MLYGFSALWQEADLSFVSAYFTIYAYDALKEQLEQVNHSPEFGFKAKDLEHKQALNGRDSILPST